MGKVRDYSNEYARRVASAKARGLSRSQGRGHARLGETPIRPAVALDRERFEAALKLYRATGNQAASAKAVQIAPECLRRLLHENVRIEGRGRTLKITDTRRREMPVISRGKIQMRTLPDFEQASLNGTYLNAVKAFVSSNDIDVLAPFVGRAVRDAKGKTHPLETDPNTLYRLEAQGSELFHEIYRFVL